MPSPGATLPPPVGDRAPAPRHAQIADLRPDLVRLALVVVVDVLFLFGVLLPYLTSDREFVDLWVPDVLSVPVVLNLFFLPWVTCGAVVFSGYQLWRGTAVSAVSRAVCLGVVVLGAAGLATYFSPWGMAAIRWLMD